MLRLDEADSLEAKWKLLVSALKSRYVILEDLNFLAHCHRRSLGHPYVVFNTQGDLLIYLPENTSADDLDKGPCYTWAACHAPGPITRDWWTR